VGEKLGTELKIFTDGGCSGNPGPGGWAYMSTTDTDNGDRAESGTVTIITEKWGAEKDTTNNRMELMAAIAALEAVRESALSPERITVFTDSQYVQKGMTQWIHGWKQKQWQTSGKERVKNQDLWQRLDQIASGFQVHWTWIRGHTGNDLNERCDRMTRKAILSIRSGIVD
jgi:ribonuclease HI